MHRDDNWNEAQRRYYDEREHVYLTPEEGGVYAQKITEDLRAWLNLPADSSGLEIGCGAGRFTIPLLHYFASLNVIDLSGKHLRLLAEQLEHEGIAPERCKLNQIDIESAPKVFATGQFDFVVGVFVLHHLRDPGRSIRQLSPLLRPGGRMAFLEPNRWNPLFTLQILFMKDFSYREEKMLYRLGARRLRQFLEDAGLTDIRTGRSGFFPPQILNRFQSALAIERTLEKSRVLDPVLPFQLVRGTRPDTT